MTPPAPIHCCVAIASSKTVEILRACPGSIPRDGRSPLPIIVVDNGSEDGTPATVRTEFPHVQLIVNDDTRGFAAANNHGSGLTGGRALVRLLHTCRGLAWRLPERGGEQGGRSHPRRARHR